MKQPVSRHWDPETMLVVWLAALVSLASFFYCLRHGTVLLYGDAVAHINIARRVFDSRTPGLLQLGTVWLPLPHLLMIPFLLSDAWWQSGAGGSLPSLAAYIFGAVGIFRLLRGCLGGAAGAKGEAPLAARIAAWLGAVVYLANPNLIYLQATAMTESLYLCLFIWAVVYFSEFARATEDAEKPAQAGSALLKCGLCLAGACLTRYDGWLLAVVACGAALLVVARAKSNVGALWFGWAKFILLAAAAPALWLGYNAIVYRNPLEFANGPYSAKAIELKTANPAYPAHPGSRDLAVAASFFLKSAELNLAKGNWGRFWLVLAVAALAVGAARGSRRLWPLLLLWVPLPFYTLSIAYGGVPIFLPVWWPHSIYNARYGLQLLPAFAISAGVVVYFAAAWAKNEKSRSAAAAALAILVAASYASVWWEQPICFREAWINSRSRQTLEREVARTLEELPPSSTLLMYLGDHVGALELAGVPLRRVINEGNHRPWMQPSDPEGLWERALADPAQYVDFVVAFDGDATSLAVPKEKLIPLVVIHTTGQPRAVVYSPKGRLVAP